MVGDWGGKMHERMGEVEGRGNLGDGVCGIVGEEELVESDDTVETDNERDLRGPMGMGSVWFDFSFEDIWRERVMKGERKDQLALVSDFIWRSLANLNMSRDLNDL